MLKGSLISLNAVEEEDLNQLKIWRNNPSFRKYFREYRELNTAQQNIWFKNKVIEDDSTQMFSIRRLSDNVLLGCCGLIYINWIHRHADLSLYIGFNNQYIDSEGYAHESCSLLFNYGFQELGLNKIWTEIYDFDNKKLELYKKFGFKLDGVLRENYFYKNNWYDSKVLSLLKKEY